MNSNALLKLIKYAKVAARHTAVIGGLVLICIAVTRPNYKLFASWLFLPLAAFITLAFPAFTRKNMVPEAAVAAALLILAHLLVVGSSGRSILFILLYIVAGALGTGFGLAVRKLGRRDKE